jgi:hypothetical protein
VSELTIREEVFEIIKTLKVVDMGHLFTLVEPFTRSRGYAYKVVGRLAEDGLIGKQKSGRSIIIRSTDYRKRAHESLDHDLGVNDAVVKFLRSCQHQGYAVKKTTVDTGKKYPDDLWMFEKENVWRLAWFEYQSHRSPLSPRVWINRLTRMTDIIDRLKRAGEIAHSDDVETGFVFFIVGTGRYYNERFVDESISRLVRRESLYFTTKGLIDGIEPVGFFTSRIWYHPLEHGNKVAIFGRG